MSKMFATTYVSSSDASEQCISPGWYLSADGFIQLGEHMVVPFETEAAALEYIESLIEN